MPVRHESTREWVSEVMQLPFRRRMESPRLRSPWIYGTRRRPPVEPCLECEQSSGTMRPVRP